MRDPPKRGARALILAPTRELASQIAVSVRDYGRSMPYLTVACIFGGVPIHRQIKKLVGGNDVLVATPGRLIDLLDRKDLRLSDVEVLVLDEADQMMDMGFIHALRKIVPQLPKERQTLFFSATMTPQIKKLAAQFLTDPVHVSVSPPNSTADKVDQSMIFVDKKEKQDLLNLTLISEDINRALIFTRTKHGADRVVKRLARIGLEAKAIHGNKSQNQRQRALAAFREGEIRFMVATDIAARGIDIEGISHVINFEIPNVPEQYVHRIGRTARAGREGKAIAFVDTEERAYLKDIQKLLKTTIPVMPLPEEFRKKIAEINKRPALPKADKPDGSYERHQDPRRKKFKKKKRPKTAEEELASMGDKPKADRPSHHGKSSKKPNKTKRQGPKQGHSQDSRQDSRKGGKPYKGKGKPNKQRNQADGERSHSGKPRKGNKSGMPQNGPRKGGKSGFKRKPRPRKDASKTQA